MTKKKKKGKKITLAAKIPKKVKRAFKKRINIKIKNPVKIQIRVNLKMMMMRMMIMIKIIKMMMMIMKMKMTIPIHQKDLIIIAVGIAKTAQGSINRLVILTIV
jgi:hypothetical protein